jgi:hypothetical protein
VICHLNCPFFSIKKCVFVCECGKNTTYTLYWFAINVFVRLHKTLYGRLHLFLLYLHFNFDALSISISFHCCTTLTNANDNNPFDWCCQTLVSIGSIINTDREIIHLMHALFSLVLVKMLIADVIVNVVTILIPI